HVPYTHRLHSGKTVIQHIYDSRADGYEQVLQLRPRWQELDGLVPEALHERVTKLLREQERSAEEWRDQLRTYFYRASGIPDESRRRIHWAAGCGGPWGRPGRPRLGGPPVPERSGASILRVGDERRVGPRADRLLGPTDDGGQRRGQEQGGGVRHEHA